MNKFKTKILDGVTRQISCKSNNEFFHQQGYFHARDRFMQMEMLRIVAQGRLSECFDDSEETFKIDKYMRSLGISHYAAIEEATIDDELRSTLQFYVDGVNKGISEGTPFEFKILGHTPAPWSVSDSILTIKAMSYLGLAQGQQDLEKLLIQLLQNAQDQDQIERIKSLAKGGPLDDMTDKEITLLKKVNLHSPLIPESYEFLKFIPKIQASNNWVSNRDGKNLHACDPHLECNRLPAIWYEMKANISEEKNFFGITMPGVPGFVMGRNDEIAFSFTYGFMDMVDHFVEEVRDGKFRFDNKLENFKIRKEIIKRKKTFDTEIFVKETRAGFLESEVEDRSVSDGFYLSMAWSCRQRGGVDSLRAITDLIDAKNIDDLFKCVRGVAISCNWLLSDMNGNIGYHQSGVLPKRKNSGLYPIAGFEPDNIWSGYYEGEELNHYKNPKEGIIVTANNRIQHPDFPDAINAPMASYRKDRATQMLNEVKEHDLELFKKMQSDTFSLQADYYIKKYQHLMKDSPVGQSFIQWNRSYDVENLIAGNFEAFYKSLLKDFFGHYLLGESVTSYCMDETAIIADFYGLFDRIFLTEDIDHVWFNNGLNKEDFIVRALKETKVEKKRWGDQNRFKMKHILFDGKLPNFLGFDIDNVEVPGNRSTLTQGSIYHAHGRITSFIPSWKMVTDHKDKLVFTSLPGGLSDRRFSKYYKSDINNYINCVYRENLITDK